MSELWENPLYPVEERLEMAVGGIQFRDKIVDSLRRQVAAQAARADRAERALNRGGYTDTAGAAEWKPPIGRNPVKAVQVIYTGPDRLMYGDGSGEPRDEFISKTHDGAVVVVQQESDAIRVSIVTPEAKVQASPVSAAYRRGVYAEGDISAIETAIIHEVGKCPSRWSGWPGARHLARAAYDAVFREVEKRQ